MTGEPWHSLPESEVLSRLGTGSDGISEKEAAARLEKHGPNELAVVESTSPFEIFIDQFKDLMVIILIFAAVISALIGLTEAGDSENALEPWYDTIVILIIVVLNALFGFFQEYKAEKALLALQAMSAPQATVIRDGKETLIMARELVPGDVVVIHTGDMIPADCRLIKSVNLKINESALTGESMPVTKHYDFECDAATFLADRKNMAYSSTTVEYGRGMAVVTETGMHTEIGKIADMIRQEVIEDTPLQQKLHKMGKQIGLAILAICAVVFLVGIVRYIMDPIPGVTFTEEILEMFMVAVSLAVAAIPEGLPAVVTISLALGLQRMAKRHALIRRLPAVETLGSTTIICSDKTGTLTMGVMNIKHFRTLDHDFEVDGDGYEPEGQIKLEGRKIDYGQYPVLGLCLVTGMLCNDTKLLEKDGRWEINGDSTEGAFLVSGRRAGLSESELNETHPRVLEIPFDSERKRMSTIHKAGPTDHEVFTKGAMDHVLPLCTHYQTGNEIRPLDDAIRAKIEAMNGDMASDAYRVLAMAYKETNEPPTVDNAESGLIFLGLAGMIDAPRKEAIDAIRECKLAGIKVVMITGDHKLTATAIARQMGIADSDSVSVTGQELNVMDDDELFNIVESVSVFARVSPEHKLRVVTALKKHGHIVAMTGDGVNDAPALKKADIGVAMGITGTDVSKEAAEMVLTDDNFASIVSAVEEGRNIYANIRKFVSFLLSCNVGEVLTIFFATLAFSLSEPFLFPIQILWMNLVTDGLPALALGLEPPDPGAMTHPPKNPNEPPINREMWTNIFIVGAIVAAGTIFAFLWKYDPSLVNNPLVDDDPYDLMIREARSIAFTTIVLFQMSYVFSARSLKVPIYRIGLFSNKYLIAAVASSIILHLCILYLGPLQEIFGTMALPLDDWVTIILMTSSIFIIMETWKAVKSRRREHSPAK